jgi:hypothetical protein
MMRKSRDVSSHTILYEAVMISDESRREVAEVGGRHGEKTHQKRLEVKAGRKGKRTSEGF